MKRGGPSKIKRLAVLLLSVFLLFTSVACELSDIGGVVGDLGDSLENMFRKIGDSINF